MVQVKFMSGRVVGDKPRPLVIKFGDDKTREAMFANARRLARKDWWKRVFLGPDLEAERGSQKGGGKAEG